MHKLIATLTNHPSASEEALFEDTKLIEFSVEFNDPDEILKALEPLIMAFRGSDTTAIVLRVTTESGAIVLRGTIKDGFSGVAIS